MSLSVISQRSILAGIIGNIIEWYDFALFACLSPLLADLFFPSSNHIVSLLSTFLVFAMGFTIRPLGAIFFGHAGDRLGRALTLKITILLISLPSIAMALLPTYQQIGYFAPLLLIILRLFQGLCIGGEFAGAMIYLVETAPPGKRAWRSSMTNNGCNIGILLATALCALITHYFTPYSLAHYGWRIPFIIGGIIGLLGIWLRGELQESDFFLGILQNMQQSFVPISVVLREQKMAVLKIILLLFVSACGSYTLMSYLSSYLNTFVGYTLGAALHLQMIFILLTLLLVPLFAWLADKYGCWHVLFWACIGYIIFAWPCYYLLAKYHSYLVMLPLIIFYSAEQATTPALIVSNFPAHTRYTGVSLAYNITMALVGGTAPLINTWLIHFFNNRMIISMNMILCALVSMLTLVMFITKQQK